MKALIFALVLIPTLALAGSSKEVVEEIFLKAAKPEISKDQAMQEEVNLLVDFGYMSKEVLGPEFNKRKKEDREWFEQTLKKIISLTVYPSAPDFLSKVNINYNEVKEGENSSTIKSVVKHKGEETEVRYSLHKKETQWKVYDIALDGESWTSSIKSEVQRILKKEGWAGLKKRLLKRTQDLSAKNKNA